LKDDPLRRQQHAGQLMEAGEAMDNNREEENG
jgi:hypothetical protein